MAPLIPHFLHDYPKSQFRRDIPVPGGGATLKSATEYRSELLGSFGDEPSAGKKALHKLQLSENEGGG